MLCQECEIDLTYAAVGLGRHTPHVKASKSDTLPMRVALVHYWLVGMRGGEKVLEALCELFPKADLFTHVVDPEKLSPQLRDRTIKTTFVARLPRARTMYKSY